MKKFTKLRVSLIVLFMLFITSLFSQTIIDNEDFEGGTFAGTIWNDGGTDCSIISNSPLNNSYSIELTDGGSTEKNTSFTDVLDLSLYKALDITFDFETDDFTGTDDFYVEYSSDGGTAWTKIGNYNIDNSGVQFTDGVSYLAEKVSITNTSNSDAFGASIIIRFRASATSGPNEGDLLFIDNILIEGTLILSGPAEMDLLGNGISIADNDTTPDVADDTQFGMVGIGQSKDRIFTIKNEGAAVLNLNNGSITGDAEFTVTTLPPVPSLNGGESTTFTLTYTPTANGVTNTATISITTNDVDENPYTFVVEGTGITPDVEIDVLDTYLNAIDDGSGNSPSIINSTDFGGTDAATPITTTFRIENNGTTDLTVGTPTSSNADFSIASNPATLISGGSFSTFDVTFTPSSTGSISSTITITNDDTDENPYTFTVQGIGYLSQTYISSGATWTYLYTTAAPANDGQGDTWKQLNFDDSSWGAGPSSLGNDHSPATTITVDGDGRVRQTTYFRHTFNVADASVYDFINLEAVRDDGIVVYLNDAEIWRSNMPSGAIAHATQAASTVGSSDETAWFSVNNLSNILVSGNNILAVELHQRGTDSSDINFDFKLIATTSPFTNSVSRGPYLQTGTSTSVIVKWRTAAATDTKVNYGTSLVSLSSSVSDATLTTEHEIQISGLTAGTKYYYNIEDAGGVYLIESNGMFIQTAPTPGDATTFVRAWILGDAGTSGNDTYGDDQEEVRDAYYNYVSNTAQFPNQTDMMLFLGDNAYNSGTDTEYQKGLFDIYGTQLKNTTAWSCLGNHDDGSADSQSQSGVYYDIFSFPKAAEAGGTASSTEAYYSFDYANIHFIVLESQTTNATFRSTQISWVTNDIAATTQDWIVAIFHHPPYTKGSHDSDTESQLVYMRENFLPILEAGGVDLILSGHSHSYERSYFINGRTGSNNNDALDSGQSGAGVTIGANGNLSGKDDTADGAYIKSTAAPEGAVYITTGSAGKATSGSVDHAAMYYSVLDIGSTILEIEMDGSGGQNMNVKFLSDDNHDYTFAVNDYFTINKTGITIVLGNETNELENKISVYPVPTNGFLNIKLANNERLQNVKFYNTIGALVKESNKEQINVGGLKTGVYMIQITSDKNTYYKSIIIE